MEDKTFEQARLDKLPEGRVNNTDTFEGEMQTNLYKFADYIRHEHQAARVAHIIRTGLKLRSWLHTGNSL